MSDSKLSPDIEVEIEKAANAIPKGNILQGNLVKFGRAQRLAGRADPDPHVVELLHDLHAQVEALKEELIEGFDRNVALTERVETLKREMEAVMHRDALLVESLRIQIETLTRERDEARAELERLKP